VSHRKLRESKTKEEDWLPSFLSYRKKERANQKQLSARGENKMRWGKRGKRKKKTLGGGRSIAAAAGKKGKQNCNSNRGYRHDEPVWEEKKHSRKMKRRSMTVRGEKKEVTTRSKGKKHYQKNKKKRLARKEKGNNPGLRGQGKEEENRKGETSFPSEGGTRGS